MNIRKAPIIQDTKLFAAKGVCKETGRKRLAELQARGVINPVTTGTGRKLLSFEDAERLAAAL